MFENVLKTILNFADTKTFRIMKENPEPFLENIIFGKLDTSNIYNVLKKTRAEYPEYPSWTSSESLNMGPTSSNKQEVDIV